MAFESQAKLYCWQIALKIYIIQLFKNAVRLLLDNFRIVVFSFSAVYEWIRLTFIFILIVFWSDNRLFWRF
jgi:hypothetical protein